MQAEHSHGPADQGTPQLEHVAHPRARYQTRACRKVGFAPPRISLPTAPRGSSRHSRSGPSTPPHCPLRSRMLLAPPPPLPLRLRTEIQQGILVHQVQRQCHSGSAQQTSAASTRLARPCRMGVPSLRSRRADTTSPRGVQTKITGLRMAKVVRKTSTVPANRYSRGRSGAMMWRVRKVLDAQWR